MYEQGGNIIYYVVLVMGSFIADSSYQRTSINNVLFLDRQVSDPTFQLTLATYALYLLILIEKIIINVIFFFFRQSVCTKKLVVATTIFLISSFFVKVEKILKGSLDLIPSPSVKIQIMAGKVCLRCKGKTLLGVVNKLSETKQRFAFFLK